MAPNLLARNFEPEAPNVAWADDVTYIATDDAWAAMRGSTSECGGLSLHSHKAILT